MSAALIAALVFTVALLVTHTYFLFGSVPLLVLEHDTPMDARFVRGFFNTYYGAAMVSAGGAALSLALAGWLTLAAGATALAVLARLLRWQMILKLDALRAQMQDGESRAVQRFRRLHVAAVLLNLAQLVLIVGSLIAASVQSRAG